MCLFSPIYPILTRSPLLNHRINTDPVTLNLLHSSHPISSSVLFCTKFPAHSDLFMILEEQIKKYVAYNCAIVSVHVVTFRHFDGIERGSLQLELVVHLTACTEGAIKRRPLSSLLARPS